MATTVAPQVAHASPPRTVFDWREFCAKHFPGQTERHNLGAVVAYGKYRKAHPLQGDPAAVNEARRADRTAIRNWEDEGGA